MTTIKIDPLGYLGTAAAHYGRGIATITLRARLLPGAYVPMDTNCMECDGGCAKGVM